MGRTADFYVIDTLRREILDGKYDHAAFLPSERSLADRFGVGRGVIRGAFRELLDEGLLCTIPGRGVRVKLQRKDRRFKRFILRINAPLAFYAHEALGLLAGICDGASRLFAEVLLSAPPVPFDLTELIERYGTGDIQGVIFLEESNSLSIESVLVAGIPCVVANLEDDRPCPAVRMDYRDIGFRAGHVLLESGARRMAVYQGSPELFIYQEMLAGFKTALAQAGIGAESVALITDDDCRKRVLQMAQLPPPQQPEAFFCMRDRRAAALIDLCEKMQLRIIDNAAMVSYDNISWPGAEEHALSTFAEDVRKIGRCSVDLLREFYETGKAPAPIVLPATLIERKSHLRQRNR